MVALAVIRKYIRPIRATREERNSIMKRVFTKRFFDLSSIDQAAVVNAAIHDLQMTLGQVVPAGRQSIRRAIRRVERKAIDYGVYKAHEDVATEVTVHAR